MQRAIEHRPALSWPAEAAAGTVTLDYDARHRRRIRLTTDGGEQLMLDLPKAVAMADGDGLLLEDGRWLGVVAAPEPVIEVRAGDAAQLTRIAWHLGNRHLPAEISDGVIRIRPDHVIEAMLVSLGADVRHVNAPFQPEAVPMGASGRKSSPMITAIRIRTIMTMAAIRTIMTTDAAKHLRLQSWFSPAFPIGAFSYSHGLEWAVEDGSVTDRASLVAWLEADLRHGSGRMDAMLFAQAWRAADAAAPSPTRLPAGALSREGRGQAVRTIEAGADNSAPAKNSCIAAATQSPVEGGFSASIAEGAPAASDLLAIAELAAAMRGTAELALESGQQGIAFLAAVRKAWPHPELERLAHLLSHAVTPVLPVAAAMCCAVHDIGLDLALPLYIHGSAANLVNAAVRLVPLGQTDGQIAIAALETAVLEVAREAANANSRDIGSAAFMIDLASMAHETQYTRLFRS